MFLTYGLFFAGAIVVIYGLWHDRLNGVDRDVQFIGERLTLFLPGARKRQREEGQLAPPPSSSAQALPKSSSSSSSSSSPFPFASSFLSGAAVGHETGRRL